MVSSVICVFKFYRLVMMAFIAALVSGCANGPLSSVPHNQAPAIDYEMVGIPLLYQGFGSSVPITKDLSLTAAHVAKLNWASVVAYHPNCDIAIIKSDNSAKTLPDLGLVYTNEPVTTYGMDGFGKLLKGEGFYRRDLLFSGSTYFDKCNASVSDAPIRPGMSGGGFFNQRGELVGIISAIASSNTRLADGEKLPYDRLSLFVSLNFIKDWLNQTVDQYYGSDQPVLTWNPTVAKPVGTTLANNRTEVLSSNINLK